MMFRALLVAALLLVHGELRAEPVPAAAGFAPKLIIYLAKGPGQFMWTGLRPLDCGGRNRRRGLSHELDDLIRTVKFENMFVPAP